LSFESSCFEAQVVEASRFFLGLAPQPVTFLVLEQFDGTRSPAPRGREASKAS
jgi:hypothetical protein